MKKIVLAILFSALAAPLSPPAFAEEVDAGEENGEAVESVTEEDADAAWESLFETPKVVANSVISVPGALLDAWIGVMHTFKNLLPVRDKFKDTPKRDVGFELRRFERECVYLCRDDWDRGDACVVWVADKQCPSQPGDLKEIQF